MIRDRIFLLKIVVFMGNRKNVKIRNKNKMPQLVNMMYRFTEINRIYKVTRIHRTYRLMNINRVRKFTKTNKTKRLIRITRILLELT